MKYFDKIEYYLRSIPFKKRDKSKRLALQNIINTFRQEYKRAIGYNLEHYARITNVGLFILVTENEMMILIKHYIETYWNDWEHKLMSRQIALLLYEVVNDIPVLLGKNFRDSLQTIPLWNEAEDELNVITKALNKFKIAHIDTLQELRNVVAAHRDHNAAKQLEIVDNMDSAHIKQLAVEYYEIVNQLIPFLAHVVEVMGNPRVILHHMTEGMTKGG